MEKLKPFILPSQPGSVLIVGDYSGAGRLKARMETTIKGRLQEGQWTINTASQVQPGFDYVYSTRAVATDEMIQSGAREFMVVDDSLNEDYTPSQLNLQASDWQAIRDTERLFIELHRQGQITIPPRIMGRMVQRDLQRAEVDIEIEFNTV